MRVLFGVTAFVASALLFVVEPLVARTMLPVLGGSASVWNSAMLVFQLLLLAGYVLAHLAATRVRGRGSPLVVVAVVLAATTALPVGLREGWRPPSSSPAVWTLLAVTTAVGGPFLALAAVSPTLQHWYGRLAPHADAYVLYAAGNAGSFIGLIAYPLLIEPTLGVHRQERWWTTGYLAFLLLFACCALVTMQRGDAGPLGATHRERAVTRQHLLRWAAMAAGPSLLLLGVTRHLATDVAAIPLLWVVPLSLYLLTFVAAFSGRARRLGNVATRGTPVLAAVAVISLAASLPAAPGVVLHLACFSCLALAVHSRLASERPPIAGLTSFYLALSAGGAAGGLLGGLVAPVAFRGVYEYPLGIVACLAWVVPTSALGERLRPIAGALVAGALVAAAVLRITLGDADGPPRVVQAMLGVAALAALAASRRARQFTAAIAVAAVIAVALPSADTLRQERTYYGVTRVLENGSGWHLLVSGTTVHGAQDPERPDTPLTYYAPGGPLADAVARTDDGRRRSIGVVGLGAGSLAAYAEPGDTVTFYEIDPAVIGLATNPDVFSFIARSAGTVEIVDGDGRLSLAAEPPARHDLLVIDAFSSDAIPVHLVTAEALEVYRRALTDDGVIVFHVSNRYFDLVPVVARIADAAGLGVVRRAGIGTVEGSFPTTAVAVGRGPRFDALAAAPGWAPAIASGPMWTDDHADVLSALQLF